MGRPPLKVLLIMAAGLAIACSTRPVRDSRSAVFQEANSLYQKGDYAGAEESYRLLLTKGVSDGQLFYNLGNACFKQKKLGPAIYYWEKARQLMPADRDVTENLQLADLMIVDRIEVPPEPLVLRWLDAAVHALTPDREARLILGLFVLANLLFTVFLLVRGGKLAAGFLVASLACAGLTLLFGSSLALKIYEQRTRIEGVVVDARSEIRSGPGPENVTVFTVHEGTRLRIRGESGEWYQISLPNGWSGWLPRRAVWKLQ